MLTSLRLPEEIAAMESLERLDLSNNHLLGYVCSVYIPGNPESVFFLYTVEVLLCTTWCISNSIICCALFPVCFSILLLFIVLLFIIRI